MDIWSILCRARALYPAQIAVVDGEVQRTYAELADRAEAFAGLLRARGVGEGSRVAILDRNSEAFLEAYFAAAGLGAVLCPLNTRLNPKELAAILVDSGARWLVTREDFADLVSGLLDEGAPLEGLVWIDRVPPRLRRCPWVELEPAVAERRPRFEPSRPNGDQVAELYYTSGTTGRPKGVMLTHRNVCTHALSAIAELSLDGSDVWGHFAPMFHLADAWATFAITWVGGRHVMSARFEPGLALDLMERERVTLTNLIPTMLNLMVHHPRAQTFRAPNLRLVLSGGAPIAPALIRRVLETFGCDYMQTYGLTETSPYVTLSALKPHLRGLPPAEQLAFKSKTGRAFLGVEVQVTDEAGRPVAADGRQVGEIRVRGDTVTPGYWNRPDETRAAFQDGWLLTGDLAVVDAEGYLNIVDRKKDMILTGGENVYSIEVESVLAAHPAVLEVAVYGVPHELYGEAVRAAVVLKPGCAAGEAELIAHCKQHLAGYKAPKSVEFRESLPRTGSGKITKKVLRDQAQLLLGRG